MQELKPNAHQLRRTFVEWAHNDMATDPESHKKYLFSDKAHVGLNEYVDRQNCHIGSGDKPQAIVPTMAVHVIGLLRSFQVRGI